MRASLLALLFVATSANADHTDTDLRGHTKVNLNAQSYPQESLFRDLLGDDALDFQGDLRINFEGRRNRLVVDAAYQLVAASGDTLELTGLAPQGLAAQFGLLPNDDRRLFDWTGEISRDSDSALIHRLDRMSFGFVGKKLVVRAGRQALSWGNGLF